MRFGCAAILFVLVSILFFSIMIRGKYLTDYYLADLHLKLEGTLTENPDCPDSYNGFCVLHVKVIKSNIDEYLPQNKLKAYSAIIKDSNALILQQGIHDAQNGDTIYVDTKSGYIVCNHLSYSILLTDTHRFYEYVEQHYPSFFR